MAKLIQWVVRGVDEDLARQFVDRAGRQRRTVGEVLNGVLRACLDWPEAPEPDGGPSPPGGAVADLAAQLAALADRVERLESGAGVAQPALDAAKPARHARKPAKAGLPASPSGGTGAPAGSRNSRAIPEEHLAEADRLNREGASFQKIIEMKGWPYNRSGLDRAVNRWRQSRS
jgi:hypothetical protein